ncbi:hypothetical protein GUITHDRAFT_144953 [Guillardia theta CCMP2712]|uniref:PA14 domain-containing protein n=1 Tax=Guillardia theta (strain CCMP2712) TaxID=905079 RepID=L1IN61_GUITC|nr:hypothetical protein GUITHDRAFT_144953 [Guillardia theta CCMP2712]EKX37532.1 hypothetical protein GUITHDRAFT_144953 [Guillardia theta CCMP2712]|eukprot:XP_005824512.1 hypothetical protein GUITHDRAFT_144953 [Guillardia theta CCMP2712]
MAFGRQRAVAAIGMLVLAGLVLMAATGSKKAFELLGISNGMSGDMQNTFAGISDADQSPVIPKAFMQEESQSKRRMKRLKSALTKSLKMSENLDAAEKGLKEYVASTVSDVKREVVEFNTKESDDIKAQYHEIQGLPGPPGLPGMNGNPGLNGLDGASGPQGPRGIQGPPGVMGGPGEQGPMGLDGNKTARLPAPPDHGQGDRGQEGLIGPNGISGPSGADGLQGSGEQPVLASRPHSLAGEAPADDGWTPGRYFCPGGGDAWTRLVDCDFSSCRLETHYNGVWGTVCLYGFTQLSAQVVCRSLGFEEGGKAIKKGGGQGPIWLSHVACAGSELDIGDCPKSCGGEECTHSDDVGVCCWGLNNDQLGERKNVRPIFKTVRHLREECYIPDKCVESYKEDKVVVRGSCLDPLDPEEEPSWSQSMRQGEWERFDNGECDDNQEMCCLHECKLNPNEIASLSIPEKFSVTLFSDKYFQGNKITYVGPRDINCLSWEGWKDRAKSMLITSAVKRPRSSWTVRFYEADDTLQYMPSLLALYHIGSTTIPYINFQGTSELRKLKYFEHLPSSNFMAIFYGNVLVQRGGEYQWCTTSSDGSQLWIDGNLVVDNDGRHEEKHVCGTYEVSNGLVPVEVRGFLSTGNFVLHAFWKGHDTGENFMLLRSEDATGNLPKEPMESDWGVRTFSSPKALHQIPDVPMVKMIGEQTGLEEVDMEDMSELQSLIPNTPTNNVLWIFYGSLLVVKAGDYQICTTSSDGSRVLLAGRLLVENNGEHTEHRECAVTQLDAGSHELTLEGFVGSGRLHAELRYSGPDTGGAELLVKSLGSSAGNLPNLPNKPSSSFLVRIYQSHVSKLDYTPALGLLQFVGQGNSEYINFYDRSEFQSIVPSTPEYNYVWAVYGKLSVGAAGTYRMCVTSNEGSLLYVKEVLVVDNDGSHGARQECGELELSKGSHTVFLTGFKYEGDASLIAQYAGPDTGNVLRYLTCSSAWAPQKPAASSWTLRVFKGADLYNMADAYWRYLTYVGQGSVQDLYFTRTQDFKQIVGDTPSSQFAWVFYGMVDIKGPGSYTFCSTSEDGSFLYVDNQLVASNDGTHNVQRKCGSISLAVGSFAIRIEGFLRSGEAYQVATYSGPDTRNLDQRMVSTPVESLPAIPPPSKWTMYLYKASSYLSRVPDMSSLQFVDKATISTVYFGDLNDLRRIIPSCPEGNYAWAVYGKVRVTEEGSYSFCSTSDDGSYVYVDGRTILENDYEHPPRKVCGSITLSAGDHKVLLTGYQGNGGVYQLLTYSGPDTRGVERNVPSVDGTKF